MKLQTRGKPNEVQEACQRIGVPYVAQRDVQARACVAGYHLVLLPVALCLSAVDAI